METASRTASWFQGKREKGKGKGEKVKGGVEG
jgi:hypothetical protein